MADAGMCIADSGGPPTAGWASERPAKPFDGDTQGRVFAAIAPTRSPVTTRDRSAGVNKSRVATNAYGAAGTKPMPTATPLRQHNVGANGAHPTYAQSFQPYRHDTHAP